MRAVKGMHDLFGADLEIFSYLEKAMEDLAFKYGMEEFRTPILEYQEVFCKPLGECSDIVCKEMYTLEDRNGEKLVLRPEGTAPLMRALIQHNLLKPGRYWYKGPMFRYERPQKGRSRQFHTFAVEWIGESEPIFDALLIKFSAELFSILGIKANLIINTIGSLEERRIYLQQLRSYFSYKDLSELSKKRLMINPLRILDSKEPEDQTFIENAPIFTNFLGKESLDFWEEVKFWLQEWQISYQENPFLVRGLDYYNHTVFEWQAEGIGSQSAILGGGRYDGLSSLMGGSKVASLGFGLGMERLKLAVNNSWPKKSKFGFIAYDKSEISEVIRIWEVLKNHNLPGVFLGYGNIGKLLKKANDLVDYVFIVAPEELKHGKIIFKDMLSGEQIVDSLDKLLPKVLEDKGKNR